MDMAWVIIIDVNKNIRNNMGAIGNNDKRRDMVDWENENIKWVFNGHVWGDNNQEITAFPNDKRGNKKREREK